MRTPPTNWTTLMAQPHETETRIDIAGVSYYGYNGNSGIWSCETHPMLFDKLSVGNCCSATINLVLVNPQTIPTMAKMELYVRLAPGAPIRSITIPRGRMRGDVNGNGTIDKADGSWQDGARGDNTYVMAHIAGTIQMDDVQKWCADANGDGTINITDAQLIANRANGNYNAYENADYYENWTFREGYYDERGEWVETNDWACAIRGGVGDDEYLDLPDGWSYEPCIIDFFSTGVAIYAPNPPIEPMTIGVYAKQPTDWVRKGIYYIDTREWDAQKEFLTITGYDAMLKAEQPYFTPPVTITGWPKVDTEVVSEICTRIGVSLDSRTVLDKWYMVQLPAVSTDGSESMTLREVLGYVGAMYGGNWVINDDGNLQLVRLNTPSATFTIPKGRMRGDVNGNGVIDKSNEAYPTSEADNALVMASAVGQYHPDDIQKWCADVDEDGFITANDSLRIVNRVNGNYNAYTNADYYGNWTWRDATHDWMCFIPGEYENIHVPSGFTYEVVAGGVNVYAENPPIEEIPADIDLGTNGIDLQTFPAYDALGIVHLVVSDEAEYTAGTTGRDIEISCPWGTQEMADNLLSALQGYVYQPLTITTEYAADPLFELGDSIIFNGVTSVIADETINFSLAYTADFSAPNGEELNHEYPFIDKAQQQIKREIAKSSASLKINIDSIIAQVTDGQGNYTALTLRSDGLHVGNAQGTVTIDGSSITAGTVIAAKVSADNLLAGTISSTVSEEPIQFDGNFNYLWHGNIAGKLGVVSAGSIAMMEMTTATGVAGISMMEANIGRLIGILDLNGYLRLKEGIHYGTELQRDALIPQKGQIFFLTS